jgi:hypothetical protein
MIGLVICSSGGVEAQFCSGGRVCKEARTLVDTGEGSRITIVSSASKISFKWSLGVLVNGGGAGIVPLLTLLERFSDFLEKIPDVHVWYFRFLDVDAPDDVRGRDSSPEGRETGASELKTSIGSPRSALGVVNGEPPPDWLNQKYFFLLGGLPELRVPGDPEADSGRLGRLIIDKVLSEAMRSDKVERASAVLGLSGETCASFDGLTMNVGFGAGLAAIELMLPETE